MPFSSFNKDKVHHQIGGVNFVMRTPRGRHNHLWRHLGELTLDTLLCRGLVARFCYSVGLQGRLFVSRYEIHRPFTAESSSELPAPAPIRIAFLSDFHAGPTTHPQIYREAFDVIAKENISLLLLGGDFVSCRARYVSELVGLIENVQAPLGKFAVFGNHDLWTDHDHIQQQLEAVGVEFLVNQHKRLPAPFSRVSIGGTDDPWTGEVNIDASLDQSAEIRLLLTHAPDGLAFVKGQNFYVAFAGHTHGGQIALSNGKPMLQPHGKLSRQYVHGSYALANKAQLIVSRGIGCSNLPIRLNAPPELVICELI